MVDIKSTVRMTTIRRHEVLLNHADIRELLKAHNIHVPASADISAVWSDGELPISNNHPLQVTWTVEETEEIS